MSLLLLVSSALLLLLYTFFCFLFFFLFHFYTEFALAFSLWKQAQSSCSFYAMYKMVSIRDRSLFFGNMT